MTVVPTVVYVEFIINFFILFTILFNVLLLMASVFKTKDYAIELVLLGMISFCVFIGIHQFMGLTLTSYRLAETEPPFADTIISEMFLLMASMLIFGIGVTKKKLQNIELGKKK